MTGVQTCALPIWQLFNALSSSRLVKRRFCSVNSAKELKSAFHPRRLLSGIQPTGSLHLGNYLGAVKRWVELQNSGEETIYSIADLHAITVPQDPDTLRKSIIRMTASLIACGLNPEKCILFQQSKVHLHTQLCWVLASLTTMGKLGQQAQLREKRKILPDLSAALYMYPILQAADILLYKATHIPVGEDQISHLNLASHLARLFNGKFGDTFPVPEAFINEDASRRLKSLRDPTKKMSKSDPDPKSRINLSDTPEEIKLKFKKAVTDCNSAVSYDPEARPGISNLVVIHSSLTGKSVNLICSEASGLESGNYKMKMADEVIEALRPIRERYNHLVNEPADRKSVV